MNRTFAILFFAILATYVTTANSQKDGNFGSQSYTPSRVEWLTVVLNSSLRKDITADSLFAINFVSQGADTILMKVAYSPDTDRKLLNLTTQMARDGANSVIKSYGWEKWFRIVEQVEMLNAPVTRPR